MICSCNHLSSFAGNFFVQPNAVDLTDLSLFSTFFENPVSVVLVLCTWIAFVLLLLWARHKDREDFDMPSPVELVDEENTEEHDTFKKRRIPVKQESAKRRKIEIEEDDELFERNKR